YKNNQKFIHHRLPRIQVIKTPKTRRTREEREELHEHDQLLVNPRRILHSRNDQRIRTPSPRVSNTSTRQKSHLSSRTPSKPPQNSLQRKNKAQGWFDLLGHASSTKIHPYI